MASGQVNIKWSSEHQQLLEAYRQLERSNAKLIQQMGVLQAKSDGAFSTSKLVSYATNIFSISAAWAAAQRAVTAYFEAEKRLRQEGTDKTVAFDEEFRKFLTIARIKDPARQKQLQGTSLGVSEKYGTATGKVAEAAKELSSAGFTDREIAEGGVLDSFVKAMKAGGASGQEFNPAEAVEAVTAMMNANNMPKTKESMDRINKAIVNLGETKLKIPELKDLAAEAQTLAGAHITLEQQLATFAALRESFSPEEGATLYRNVVGRLQTAAGTPAKSKALKSLGIDPSEVDFVGETQEEVFARLRKGLAGVDEETGNVALGKLFEERGVAGGRALLKSADKIQENLAAIANDKFNTGLEIALQGPEFEKTQAGIADEREAMGRYETGESSALMRAKTRATQNAGAVGRGITEGMFGIGPYDAARAFGAGPETAGDFAEFAAGILTPGAAPRTLISQADRAMGGTAEAGSSEMRGILSGIAAVLNNAMGKQQEAARHLIEAADAIKQSVDKTVPVPGQSRASSGRPPRLPVSSLNR